jgi:cysteinyl-tRNA synthetase
MSSEQSNTTTKWFEPETDTSNVPVLKLFNTLTHSKVEFKPIKQGKIKWYSCGPTVYNSSHMGHARNYVSIDINRRIMQDYFNYDITFIQNVTDIDDKIILKARQEYLFEEFVKKLNSKINSELLEKSKTSINEYIIKNLPEFKSNDINEFKEWSSKLDLAEIGLTKPKFPMHIKAVNSALEVINNHNNVSFDKFISQVKDVIVLLLDKELGSTVVDPTIFRKCSSYWERQYDLDMEKLNVLPPTIVTRVSEYIPEIISYIEEIVKKGYAYSTTDGSVYFNTSKFDNSENHQYAKCQPWSKGDMELLEDGEGSLTNKISIDNKINPSDFALWKSSKEGEPFWESPWGKGRPGWHIECSVMGSDFAGDKMDIHSGGIDLAFPHHDNEMAQSEAHFDCKQWVNYFLHTGHLHIEGQKMSKSLKNFITIDEALEKYSSRELRLCFALVQWNNSLDFKESLLNETKSVSSTLDKFFNKIRALKRDNEEKLNNGEIINKKFGKLEKKLFENFEKSKEDIHKSLCDNLATPLAIRNMMELVNSSNIYLNQSNNEIKIDLVVEIVKYLTKMLKIFGFEAREDNLGWKEERQSINNWNGNINKEEVCMPFIKILSKFRDLVREVSIEGKDSKILLEKCDLVRDNELLELGVALDDRSDGKGALIKFLNDNEKEELLKLQREKEAITLAKKQKKIEQARIAAEKEKERLEKGKLSPLEMFKTEEMKKLYKEWDEEGLPLKTIDGEEVSKSGRKKLVKQQQQQAKLHAEYLKTL